MGFQVGPVVFPLVAVSGNPSLVTVADPALAKVLEFFSFMLTTYVGSALLTAAAMSSAPIVDAVAQVAPINPNIIAKAEQWQFPLVCGWRQTSKDSDRTLNWRQGVATVRLAVILPPLSPTQRIMLEPILNAVGKLANYAIAHGSDPGFNSGEKIYTSVFISRARLMSEEFGSFQFDDAKEDYFPSWVGEFELTEQVEPYTVGLPDLVGEDLTLTQQEDDGGTLFATGTNPPVVTIGGPTPFPPTLRVEIQAGGLLGAATFRVSLDGVTWVASTVTTAASYTIPSTSNVLHFPAGTYTNNNVYVAVPVVVIQAQTDV